MVKAEWGTKRTCPKCGTRFYDLGKEDPVTCIECGVSWEPEPVLKSKQPLPFDEPKKNFVAPAKEDSSLAAEEDLDIDEDAEEQPDDEVDHDSYDDTGGDSQDAAEEDSYHLLTRDTSDHRARAKRNPATR